VQIKGSSCDTGFQPVRCVSADASRFFYAHCTG
jgi:hypothetical protein